MGCKGSKLDDQEPVALCRARAELLAAAVRHRYALADAHAALAGSVDAVAAPLHRLLRLAGDPPRLDLPHDRKQGDAGAGNLRFGSADPSSQLPPHGHSSAHIQFSSSSGSEPASPADSPPDHFPYHPQPHFAYGYAPQPAFAYPAPAAGSLQFYYARSRPPPASVTVAQRPPERVHFGSFDAASGYPPQYHAYGAQTAAPPSPPKASAWDFLSVFENYDSYGVDAYYYHSAAAYTPSRSSREVREEEGIPDLEDADEDDVVVVKEVSREHSGPGSDGARSRRRSVRGVAEFDDPVENVAAHTDVTREARRRALAHRNVSVPASAPPVQRPAVRADADVASEIRAQLVRTADAARQLAPLLEVGRPSHHHGRSTVYHCEPLHRLSFLTRFMRDASVTDHFVLSTASSRVISAISVSHLGCKDVDLLDVGFVGKVTDSSCSLSSALDKLYFWERKLYGEVKVCMSWFHKKTRYEHAELVPHLELV
jgi:hypothetical protein